MLKAALSGALIAMIVALLLVGLVALGVVDLPLEAPVPERVLVLATAPDEDGAQLASVAFVTSGGSTSATIVDVDATVTVSGTSATSARGAYPFGGGSTVEAALRPQTGSQELPWVALGPEAWESLIDQAGGIEVDVPSAISTYRTGSLVLLEPGRRRITGQQAVALASASRFFTAQDRAATTRALASGLSGVIGTSVSERVGRLVAEGLAESSLPAAEVSRFFTAR